MNVDLSRRVGRLMTAQVIRSLPYEEHLKFVAAVASAPTFEELGEPWQEIVLQAEGEAV